jgi:acyl-CoA synthetase (NDP forming)
MGWPPLREPLSEAGARAYLAPLAIASPADRLVRSAEEAVAAFETLGGPVALKVQAAGLAHKTEVGGVHLGLRSADEVRAAFRALVASALSDRAERPVEGVLVQRMAPPEGVEVFLAARSEPLLGPLVVVGLGGIDVETTRDVAMRLAPVSPAEARSMLAELRGAGLLQGSRGRPAADVDALVETVVRFSSLAAELPEGVRTVELNPLLVLPRGQGVLMLDAAIELDQAQGAATS